LTKLKNFFPKEDAFLNGRNYVSHLALLSPAEKHDSWHRKGKQTGEKNLLSERLKPKASLT